MSSPRPAPASWPDLRSEIDNGDGVCNTSMRVLRTLVGSKRLDPQDIEKIQAELDSRNIGYLPRTLGRADTQVLLYEEGSRLDEVLRAIEAAQGGELSEAAMVLLREVNESPPEPPTLEELEAMETATDVMRKFQADFRTGLRGRRPPRRGR
ncbi:hypothetical protein ACMA1D_10560 [Streptomyces sp. 796.1]|uniref:hypothetical protein n=1 Tax=Streptomyces sp. 796.1 TaxID=3163029 RepID=UPI0039C90427